MIHSQEGPGIQPISQAMDESMYYKSVDSYHVGIPKIGLFFVRVTASSY